MTEFGALKVCKALLARTLFAAHGLTGIWRLFVETRNYRYWLLGLAPIALFLEAAVTVLLRHGDEYKWFCPSIFLFLCGSVPPIWFLEISTTDKIVNNKTVFYDPADDSDTVLAGYLQVMFPLSQREIWLKLLEQSLLVVLIVGRWLLPKGRISRDELSQLLLAYLAISSDIAELFNLFNELEIRKSVNLTLATLTVWSVSLVQFPMVLTTVKSQKARYCWAPPKPEEAKPIFNVAPSGPPSLWRKFCDRFTDVSAWGILSTVVLQDGPFFALRIYLLVKEKIYNYTLLFFISKNSLIIVIQLYRLIVICCERSASKDKDVALARDNFGDSGLKRGVVSTPNLESNGVDNGDPLLKRALTAEARLCSTELIDL